MLFFAASAAYCVACGGGSSALTSLTRDQPRRSFVQQHDKPKASVAALPAYRFAEVNVVVGPYIGREADTLLAAWAEAEANGRALFALPIAPGGVPGKSVRVGKLAGELDLVLVRGF